MPLPIPVIGIDATVGADSELRDLIRSLPENVVKQIEGLIDHELPVFKANFDQALKEVNDDITGQLKAGECTIKGLEKEASDEGRATVGLSSGPMEIFAAYERKRLRELIQTSKPREYANIYADLSHKASVTYCQLRSEPGAGAYLAFDDQMKYAKLGYAWARLVGECQMAADCVPRLQNATQFFLVHSDPRDVMLVHAAETLANIPKPKAPSLFSRFDADSYAQPIDQMIQIQDAVSLAKAIRQLTAAKAIADGEVAFATGEGELTAALQAIQPTHVIGCFYQVTKEQVALTNTHINNALPYSAKLEADIVEARDNDATLQESNADALSKKLVQMKQDIKNLSAAAVPKDVYLVSGPDCKVGSTQKF